MKVPVIWKVVAEILQDTAESSPGGALANVDAQVAPASAALKPEPAIETNAKDSPLTGVNVINGVTANVPVPKPPPTPVTCTLQAPPCAFRPTVKAALRVPELIVHVGEGVAEKRLDPAGAVIVHGPLSADVKAPDTVTAVPVGP